MSIGQSLKSSEADGDALTAAIEFFHDNLGTDVRGSAEANVDTPREYFTDVRGWSEEIIEELKLGYAPKSEQLKGHLQRLGYSDEELLATGLFTESGGRGLSCLFKGRYVFPYYDETQTPAYATARKAGPHSTLDGKYVKNTTSGQSEVREPIFGIHEFEPEDGCWIVEGIADAITALELGMPVLSPVTTQFKQEDKERLLEILEDNDVEKVVVVADNDDAGIKGAVSTAAFLGDSGYTTSVTTPPDGEDDFDGFVDSREDLEELANLSTLVEEHELYDEVVATEHSPKTERVNGNFDGPLSDVTIPDVAPSLDSEYRGRNPLCHSGSREDYFIVSEDGRLAYDHKKKVGYNAFTYLLCEIGERRANNPNGKLSDEELRTVLNELEDRGMISDGDAIYHSEQAIALPEISSPTEWDWRDGSTADEPTLTLSKAQSRCQSRIETALRQGEHTLVDALPAMGKSHGVILGAAKTDTPITVFTARHDLYGQYKEWCNEHGMTYHRLPSFHEDCPTARGDHGEDWQEDVLSLYRDGVMAGEIHQFGAQHFGETLPCDDGQECPYKQKWDFEPEDCDVLIGHYQHAYNPNLTVGRVAVFDEFPADAFLLEFDGDVVPSAVSTYLAEHDALPFEDFTDLLEGRTSERGEEARDWFDVDDLERDGKAVLTDDSKSANAYAPLLTYALLAGNDLGNGWEHADFDSKTGVSNHRRAARNRDSGEVVLLLPPELADATGVIALDGTPTLDLWQLAVDNQLSHMQILSDEERGKYLTDALGFSIVRTTDAAKTYSSGTYVKPEEDGLLFEAVADQEETEPALISTSKAITQYQQENVLGSVGKHAHYGNLKGSNQFAQERVGIVAGSQHYGDGYVKRWGALDGQSVERGNGKGLDLDYGSFGNKVLRHMREHEVLQAALRFGRDGEGANVYVHTAALPEWVPISEEVEVERWSRGTRDLIELLVWDAPNEWRTSELTDEVDISERQVRTNLNRLAESGYIEKREEGRGYTWVVEDEEIDRLGRVQFRSP